MERRYEKAPLLEAVFEIRFTQRASWDLTIPGLIYERIKGRFPQKERRVAQEIGIVVGPEGLTQQARTSELSLFFQQDRKMLVQVGPRVVSLHCLRPYPGWGLFKESIAEIYNAIENVVEIKELERIALRYINMIEIDEKRIEPKDYFNIYIFLGEQLPQDMVHFNIECVFPYEEGRDVCRIQFTTPFPTSPTPTGINFLLDIGYFLANPGSIRSEQVLEWLEMAHQRIQNIFEGSITDKLRKLFQEVK